MFLNKLWCIFKDPIVFHIIPSHNEYLQRGCTTHHTITTDRPMIMHIRKSKTCNSLVWNIISQYCLSNYVKFLFLNKCISHPRIKTQKKKEEEKLSFTCQGVPQSLEGLDDAHWRALWKKASSYWRSAFSYSGMVRETDQLLVQTSCGCQDKRWKGTWTPPKISLYVIIIITPEFTAILCPFLLHRCPVSRSNEIKQLTSFSIF